MAPINGQAIRTAATASKAKKDDYKDPWDNPERDYVNFPRRQNPEFTPPVRHHWIPESFFKAFHAKTGVTGPYMFTGGIITFLLSKEYWVVEHEFKAGIEFFVVFGLIVRYAGPHIRDAIDEFQAERENHVREIRAAEIDKQKAAIAAEEEAQFMASSYEELIAAKKEAVGLQLEAEYRSRLATAYDQVKNKDFFCIWSKISLFHTMAS